jgi:hypothetical protein
MPLTKVTNKHLLGIGHKPMIYYPIEKLTSAASFTGTHLSALSRALTRRQIGISGKGSGSIMLFRVIIRSIMSRCTQIAEDRTNPEKARWLEQRAD